MKNNNLLQVSLKWGGILAGISILALIINYAFGFRYNSAPTLIIWGINIIIDIVIVVMANLDFRNKYMGGYIKYGQCFLNGIMLMAISGLIISLLTFILYQIDYESFMKQITDQISDYAAMPNAPKSQLELLNNLTPMKFSAMQLARYLIWGLILALIVSAFTRKKNNTFEGVTKDIE